MILNPWVIGMFVSLLGMLILYAYALAISVRIVRKWDINSLEDSQLALERKSYLASTIIQYGLAIQILSLILFYMTLESLSEVIPGAMCATGSLKANAFGFPSLFVKMAVALLCAVWIIIHYVDSKLEDFRLTKMKYKFLLALAPLLLADMILQFLYFVNLDPNVISSCCGVVFEIEGEGFGSSVASLPPHPMMFVFFISAFLLPIAGYFLSRKKTSLGWYFYSSSCVILFIFSILSIISFIAPYVYEMPTLHCPFNLMRKEYGHVGYALYAFLFAASFLSLVPGLVEFLKRKGSHIAAAVGDMQTKALIYSLVFWGLFVAIPVIIIVLYETRSDGTHLFA